jgi:hypothetical protein
VVQIFALCGPYLSECHRCPAPVLVEPVSVTGPHEIVYEAPINCQ